MQKKRLIKRLLLIGLAFALLFFALTEAIEAHHDCTGTGCPVCAHLVLMRSLRGIFLLSTILFLRVLYLRDASRSVSAYAASLCSTTPVSNHVRLSE